MLAISTPSLFGNSENTMTPARLSFLAKREQARQRIRSRRDASMIERAAKLAGFVFAPGDSRHVIHHDPSDSYGRGIVYADGTIHFWDGWIEHFEYAQKHGLSGNIVSYAARGVDGWGFYVRDGRLDSYKIPTDEIADAVAKVLGIPRDGEKSYASGEIYEFEEIDAADPEFLLSGQREFTIYAAPAGRNGLAKVKTTVMAHSEMSALRLYGVSMANVNPETGIATTKRGTRIWSSDY